MKKLITILFAFAVMMSVTMLVQAAEKEIIKSLSLPMEDAELTINKYLVNDEIGIEIVDKAGNKLLDMPALGTQDKLFSLMDKPENLALLDVNGDGVQEVITSAFYGPASALYVFKYDSASKKFNPVKFADSDDVDMHRDFMVSDLPGENGKDMAILSDLSLRARGKIFPATMEGTVKSGEYLFKFADGVFKLIETKELAESAE